MVNKTGLNFADRQMICLEHQTNTLKQHENMLLLDGEKEDAFRFQPELNSKSRSLVENKKVPRNAPGYSRANYYVYIKPESTESDSASNALKSHNDKILQNNPKLQEYLAMDVTERLLDSEMRQKILYARNKRKKEECSAEDEQQNAKLKEEDAAAASNEKKMSEIELEDFIERQKQYEMVRKKRIQKLWKRFNDEKSENEQEDIELNVSSIIRDHEELFDGDTPNGTQDNDNQGLSYTQLFHSKQPTSDSHAAPSYSILSQKQMHTDSQFVTM